MKVVPFKAAHIEDFLAAAVAERWITDRREMDFLLGAYPEGCLVAEVDGHPVGFITAMRYSRSAWIGNLLVLPDQRQQGIGRRLISRVLLNLDFLGCQTVWLTASSDGAHLYRTLGFQQIDRVQRWVGRTVPGLHGVRKVSPEPFVDLDCLGWGDSRRALFVSQSESSIYPAGEEGFLISTAMGEGLHIGPWGAASARAATHLLAQLNGHGGREVQTFLDVPEGNSSAGNILGANGFSVKGSTLLMYRGRTPEYRPEYIYSLASMGSYG